MYSNTTLVAIGDSFIYGHYEDDLNYNSCWQRSWVKKLEKIGNFKTSINMGAPGGCNARSYRMLIKFLEDIYDSKENYLLIYGITDMSRFELPVFNEDVIKNEIPICYWSPYDQPMVDYQIFPIGPWTMDQFRTPKVIDYIKFYYGFFDNAKYQTDRIIEQLLSISALLEKYNIKYYYFETGSSLGLLKNNVRLGTVFPEIEFYYNGDKTLMANFLLDNGYKHSWCKHFNHDANEFLAEYIFNQIKDEQ